MLFMRNGHTYELAIVRKLSCGGEWDLFFEITDLSTTEKEIFLLVRMDAYDMQVIVNDLKRWYNKTYKRGEENARAKRKASGNKNILK